jgi:Putative transposase, YhgA-like
MFLLEILTYAFLLQKTTSMAITTNKTSSKKDKDHDNFVRAIFGFTELVLKILHYTVPDDLKVYVDFSTLKMLPETHIDDQLRITHSDTIYEAALNKEALPIHIRKKKKLPNFRFCFLGEFKSSKPAQPIDFQMDGYIRRIQELDLNNGRPPSLVIPILLYHGVQKWKNKRL